MQVKKAAIWGSGYIANTHAQALAANGIPIKTVIDVNLEHAKSFAQRWNCESFGTEKALLLDDEICAVHICTPPNMHYEMVKFLLQHNKNVFCEKPLCFETQQGKELAALAAEKGLICGVNLNVRCYPACQQAKAAIEGESFGQVFLVHGTYLQEFHLLPCPYGWRYDEQTAGKMRAVTEIGTHWLNLCEYFCNEKITKVSAQFGGFHKTRRLQDGMMYEAEEGAGADLTVNSEDCALIQFMLESGGIGSVVLSEISHGRKNHLAIEVTGSKKSLWWNSEESSVLHISDAQSTDVKLMPFEDGGFSGTFITMITNYYKQLDMATIACPDIAVPDFAEASRITMLCNTIYDSAVMNGDWKEVKEE